MVSFQELKEKYPIHNIAPYGACIVVPGNEFDPDWEAELEEQGVKCFFTDLDKRPVTLVQLKRSTPWAEKLVYGPPVAASPSKAKRGRPKDAGKTMRWSQTDNESLLREWQRARGDVEEKAKALVKQFPGRTPKAIELHYRKLLRKGSRKCSKCGLPPDLCACAQEKEEKIRSGTPSAEEKAEKRTHERGKGPESKTAEDPALKEILETVSGLTEVVDKLGCQVIMHALEIKELKGSDGFKIPLRLWASYADAVLESDKKYRDVFREKVRKLLEASE